jgi:hypothetical protein
MLLFEVTYSELLSQFSIPSFFTFYILFHAVTQLVEALRYQPEGRGIDSR